MSQNGILNDEWIAKKKEEHRQTIVTREDREKAEVEAKLLGTAMQNLLPEIFIGQRVIPNCFLRGALFGMVRKGRRALVKEEPIFTMSQYQVAFSGELLDQNDLELWDTLICLAKHNKIENLLKISLYELCQIMRLSPTKSAYEAIISRTKRLKFGMIQIKTENREFGGSLIDNYYIDKDGNGKLVIEYNKHLTELFSDSDITYVNANIRHELGDNQLAKWLHNFYESHTNPRPIAISFLQQLCRSKSEPKEFKRLLKVAIDLVKQGHLLVNQKSKWDYEITINGYLLVYLNGKNKKIYEESMNYIIKECINIGQKFKF